MMPIDVGNLYVPDLVLAGERPKDKKDLLQVKGLPQAYLTQGDTI